MQIIIQQYLFLAKQIILHYINIIITTRYDDIIYKCLIISFAKLLSAYSLIYITILTTGICVKARASILKQYFCVQQLMHYIYAITVHQNLKL